MTTSEYGSQAAPSRNYAERSSLAGRLMAGLRRRAGLAAAAAVAVAGGTIMSAALALPALADTRPLNCAASPSACGFPDATTTGVSDLTTLTSVPGQATKGQGWYWDPRGFVEVNGNGATVSGLSVDGSIDVSASNATVTGNEVTNSGQSSFGISLRHVTNVTVSNNSIHGANATSGRLMVGVKDVYGDSVGTTVEANNIYWAATGVQLSAGLIDGNYIHDMGYIFGDHVNGTTSNGGTSQLTISNNTILNNMSQTDAVSLFQDNGPQANRTITGNLLAGGSYSLYAGSKPGSPATNIQVTGNVFSPTFFPKSGLYGPVAYYTSGNGSTWSGNTWDNTGLTIPSPN
jgi:hypothetical protein